MNFICAGGIIYDAKSQKIVVVQGIEKWSLPKGHREIGESAHETAMREIREETSIKVIISQTSRFRRILKSIYYLISVVNTNKVELSPIDTNEIICVRWCNKQELYSLDCNKQLKYLIRHWDQIIEQFQVGSDIVTI